MNKLKVFYDGSCHLCDKEVKHYLKKDKNNKLIPINIMDKDFDASSYGLDDKKVQVHLHAIDDNGNIFTKVDTFIEIWKRIPGYGWAAKLASKKGVSFVLDKSYIVFAEYIRPRLPKKNCHNGQCNI